MESFIGDIRLFAGNFAPKGWMFCDGSLRSISSYETLFLLIGTNYGGDGQSTFALPDLRGRVPVGQGAGPGLSNRVLSQIYGSESVTLLTTQLPPHNHPFHATPAAASSAQPGGKLFARTGLDNIYGPAPKDGPQPQTLAANMVSPAGSSLPHDNIMPSMGLNYIIAFEGVFPSRN